MRWMGLECSRKCGKKQLTICYIVSAALLSVVLIVYSGFTLYWIYKDETYDAQSKSKRFQCGKMNITEDDQNSVFNMAIGSISWMPEKMKHRGDIFLVALALYSIMFHVVLACFHGWTSNEYSKCLQDCNPKTACNLIKSCLSCRKSYSKSPLDYRCALFLCDCITVITVSFKFSIRVYLVYLKTSIAKYYID